MIYYQLLVMLKYTQVYNFNLKGVRKSNKKSLKFKIFCIDHESNE